MACHVLKFQEHVSKRGFKGHTTLPPRRVTACRINRGLLTHNAQGLCFAVIGSWIWGHLSVTTMAAYPNAADAGDHLLLLQKQPIVERVKKKEMQSCFYSENKKQNMDWLLAILSSLLWKWDLGKKKFGWEMYLEFSRNVDEVENCYLLWIFFWRVISLTSKIPEKKSHKTYFPLHLFKEKWWGDRQNGKLASGYCLYHSHVNANKVIWLLGTLFAPKHKTTTKVFASQMVWWMYFRSYISSPS